MLSQPTRPDYLKACPRRPMRILVACEYSGRVRDAFAARGHDAISCDLLPTDAPGPHVQGDVLHLLKRKWDLVVAFPPCTYLAASQLWRCLPSHDPEGIRWHNREESLEFVQAILNTDCPRLAMENPKGCISTRIYWDPGLMAFQIRSYEEAEAMRGKPSLPFSQMIQPFEYGHPDSKETCLWLKSLPKLEPTNILDIKTHGYYHEGEQCWRWQNQTGKGYNKLGETKEKTRWKLRSLTYDGIAKAMAEAWSPDLTN